jgi:c-di-GMP-related signal transduction protein
VDSKPVAARQPIFDPHQKVFGYELLFRSSLENFFPASDGDLATSRVLDSFMSLGLEALWHEQKAFINFTRNALVQGFATFLPKHTLTVEILEDVEPDAEVVAACHHLKDLGYQIALDDVTSLERRQPLLELADIVKVDFVLAGEEQQQEIPRRLRPLGVKLLAEKVETREQFASAVRWGYHYFQGYFFCKPQLLAAKEIPTFKLNYLQLLQAVHRPELDFRQIESVLRRELSLSYRLLKYMNSALFSLRGEIRSIRHALALMGEDQIKRWVALVSMMMMASDKPTELLVTSLTRARFCELLSAELVRPNEQPDFFLMGLLSLIDAILDRPMQEVLDGIPLAREIRVGLLGGNNLHGDVYRSVVAFERADWEVLSRLLSKLRLTDELVSRSYLKSVKWATEVFGLAPALRAGHRVG